MGAASAADAHLLSLLKDALQLSLKVARRSSDLQRSRLSLSPAQLVFRQVLSSVDKVLVPAGEAAAAPPAWVLGRQPIFGSFTAAHISARAGPLPLVKTMQQAHEDGAGNPPLSAAQ